MGALWTGFLEIFQVGLFWLTHFYGGHLGAAIISFSLLARLALLPLTVRLSLRARAHARRVKKIQPALERVRERYAETPERLMAETMAVYERNGLKMVDGGLVKGTLLQMPLFLGIFHAVRGAVAGVSQPFLWVSSIARPDVGIALIASALVGVGALAGASETQPPWSLAVPAIMAGAMALTLSAGFGLYLASAGLVGTLQGLLVRRIEASLTKPA